jgi:hypothetical protein
MKRMLLLTVAAVLAAVMRMSPAGLNFLSHSLSNGLKRMNAGMRTIMMTYPGFQTLPRGIKRMLVASESFFFGEAQSRPMKSMRGKSPAGAALAFGMTTGPVGRFPAFSAAWRN